MLRNKSTWRRQILAVSAGLFSASIIAGPENEQVVQLNIASQSLGQSINEFARQTGLQVAVFDDVGADITTSPVNGAYPPHVALQMLLANTGLSVESVDDRTYAIRAGAGSGPVVAQDSGNVDQNSQRSASVPAARNRGAIEEIIVSAQKRDESLNEVPASIAAFTSESMQSSGVTTTQALEWVVPGLVFTSFNGGSQPYVRGIGADNNTVASESPFAMYVDGVYRPAHYTGIQDLEDVERVEVLLGPQGTLYGRNSTAGAMNIITHDPTSETLVKADVSYGNYDSMRASGMVSGGNDVMAASLSVLRSTSSGYLENLVDGADLNDQDLWVARGKIKVTPSDTFSATLAYDYTRSNDRNGSGFVFLPAEDGAARPLPALLGGRVSIDPRKTYANTEFSHTDKKSWGLGLTLRKSFDTFDVVSITGHSDFSIHSVTDIDASDLEMAMAGPGRQMLETFSQEFQLVSNDPDAQLEWILGAYAFTSDAKFLGLHSHTPMSEPPYVVLNGGQTTEAYAVFGQATYDFTEKLSLTLGGRYSVERKKLEMSELFIPMDGVLALAIAAPQDSTDWDNFSPKVTLQYQLSPESMVYATYSEAFKSGNYNILGLGEPPVNPEEMKAFEVGGKHSLWDYRLQFNWSLYHYDYKELQVTIVVDNVSSVENAASSKVYGADASFLFDFGRGFTGRLGANYLDAEYDEYENGTVYMPDPGNGGYGNILVAQDVSGNEAARSPELVVSAGLTYEADTALGGLTLSGNYYYNDGFYFYAGNTVRQDSYGLFNARAELALSDSNLILYAWGNNLTDEDVLMGVVQIGPGDIAQYANPRLYGVGVKYIY